MKDVAIPAGLGAGHGWPDLAPEPEHVSHVTVLLCSHLKDVRSSSEIQDSFISPPYCLCDREGAFTMRLLRARLDRCAVASLVAETVKRLPAMWETRVRSLGWEDPLEKEMATYSSILAWKIPWIGRAW